MLTNQGSQFLLGMSWQKVGALGVPLLVGGPGAEGILGRENPKPLTLLAFANSTEVTLRLMALKAQLKMNPYRCPDLC